MASEPKNKLKGIWPKSSWKTVLPEELKPLRSLYRLARFLDVYELAQKIGPLQTWMGEDARNFAADLAGFLAGYRLSDWLDVTSYRHTPQQEDAQLGYVAWLKARRGPLIAWWYLDQHPFRSDHSAEFKFRWLSYRAGIALKFRDFELAKKFAAEAKEFCPRAELLPMLDCFRFRAQDRPEEALAAARQAYAINPTHVAGLRQIAEILLTKNDDNECFSFLKGALDNTQDNYLLSLRIRLHIEKEQFSEALTDLDLYEQWTPLLELEGKRWLNARRADACYHLDRYEESIQWARKVNDDFYGPFATRLENEKCRMRVRVPVGFIRQDHNTCGPATLTALANFWGLPADHGEVSESVGYDGSYDYQERKWVEENGFYVREFKVTWDAARSLIDLGIPFALVTSWPGGAHLQAVIGYDDVWKSLLIRDPGERDVGVFDWKKTDDVYQAVGPRGMAFVPANKRELIESLDLPEAPFYDGNYHISLALFRHQRGEAIKIFEELESKFPGHRMTIVSRRLIADYDNNTLEQVACIQKLLQLFPADERYTLSLVGCLRDLGCREERLNLLRSLIGKKDCHALFWKEFAIELKEDSRAQKEALNYLKKAHRSLPQNTQVASKIADVLWDRGEIASATDIYRFVACADDKRESASRSFFVASRQARRLDEAINFFNARFLEYGPRSPDPIRTLFYALEQLDQIPEAFAQLDKAISMRPNDGYLLCYAAETYRRYGKREESRKLLADAEKGCPRARWLRTSGRLAEEAGELVEALGYWRQVALLEPLSDEAHREIADLLSKTQSKNEAFNYLRSIHKQFPFNLDISKLLLSWLRIDHQEDTIALCRTMVANHPTDAWAVRELASQLGNVQESLEEALKQAALGRDLDPRAPAAYSVIGNIYRRLGQPEEAKESFREAIRKGVDNAFAIEWLIELNSTQEEKRKDLLFIRDELVRQVVFGDGLLEFRRQAQRALPATEVLEYLKEAKEARPDLWQAWSSLTYQLSHMRRLDEAVTLAEETTQRFPLTAGSWRNLGDMYGQTDKWKEASMALEKAVGISSDWISAITDLAEVYQRLGQSEEAQILLERSLRNNPTSPVLHGYLADILNHEGKRDEALREIRRAIELDPLYSWGIGKLREWSTRDECLEVCRSLTKNRAGDARSWRILADHLDSSKERDEKFHALDRSIALEPQDPDAYDKKAIALAKDKRFAEALEVCQQSTWGGIMPLVLRGRSAWIENERGNRKLAIEMMERLVADDSSYYSGWARLSDWLLDEKRAPDAVRAADNMVRLKPRDAEPYGYRADAKLKQGDRLGALEDLRRAHVLDHDYGFATWALFDLILDDEEYGEAAALLEDARRYSKPSKVLAAEIRLELSRKHMDDAVIKLKSFGASAEVTIDTLEEIQKEFEKKNALKYFDGALEDAVSSGSVSGPALYIWIHRKTSRSQGNVGPVLDSYLQRDREIARFGIDSYLRSLGDNDRFESYALTLYQRHGAWLGEDTYTWGLMGFFLNSTKRHELCAKWMADWRTRQGIRRWMLVNLSESLRNLSREAESEDVNRRILEIESTNSNAGLHLAFDVARQGNYNAAEEILNEADTDDLKNDLKLYLLLVREIIAFSKDHERLYSFGLAKNRLTHHFSLQSKPDWQLTRAYYLGLAKLAELSGKPYASLYRFRVGRGFALLFQFQQKTQALIRRITPARR